MSIVPSNPLVVSVSRSKERDGAFALACEGEFLQGLTAEERRAVVAHELGHVWIFTHHPFLQTEELANQMALRLVNRAALESVYEKVWKRVGSKGALRYLPVD